MISIHTAISEDSSSLSPLSFLSEKPHLMIPKILKKIRPNKYKTHNVHEATDSVGDHAELDNARTTSATTVQTVHTSDHAPADQHNRTTSRWPGKKVTWNTTKLILDLLNQTSAFPPVQNVAGLLLNLVNRYELTSANKDSVQSVVTRIQYLNDEIVQHGYVSDPGELKRRERLNTRLTEISDNLRLLLSGNVVERFLNSTDDAGALSGFVEDIRDAITEYQVSLQQDIYSMNCQHLASDHLNFVDKLPRAKNAGYRSGNRQPCLKGTRMELLQELEHWATSTDDLQIFWLNGMAGTGKSSIAQSFAERLFADGILGATFYFSRDFADRSDIKLVFPTIAFQLAYQLPKFGDALVDIIKAHPDVGHLSLADQLEQLLVNPFKLLAANPESIPQFIIIVLDALDECKDPEPESKILSLLSKYIEEIPFLRFFITSRPEYAVRSVFNRPLKYRTKELILQDVDRTTVDRDIRMYLTTRLSILANRSDMDVDVPWPSLEDIDVIVHKCSGLFIYASTTINFIEFIYDDPRDRLKLVTSIPDSNSGEGRSIIDPLYTQVLVDGFAQVKSDNQAYFDRLKLVIGTVLLAINPLTRPALAMLLDVTPSMVTVVLRPLYSVLQVPSDDTYAIQRLHKSFPDFLTDPSRCKHPNFHVDAPIYHGKIAFRCLQLMKKSLKKNICRIPPYAMNKDVEDLHSRRKEFVSDALEYACRFWTHHVSLASGEDIGPMLDLLQDFFEHRFLFWVEVLSILEDLGIAIYSLRRVEEWLRNIAVPTCDLQNSIADCQRFALKFFDIIQTSVPHIYHSALPSLPTTSHLLQQHVSELATEARVVGGVSGSSWDACIRTIQVPEWTSCVAFSPDGKTIASGNGYMVQIFDAITGVCEITLGSHPAIVTSLMFSPDGSLLASSSKDSIMLWDIQTGGLVRKLDGHTGFVKTLAFSPSGTTLVSSSTDSDIRVWNPASGNCDGIIKDHSSPIDSFCWLSDTVVVSGSEDHLVKLWDIPGRRWLKDFSSHTGHVCSVACSADGSKLASASLDGTVKVYDVSTGTTLKTIPMQTTIVNSVSLSPKGDRLVYGSSLNLHVWDLSRDILLSALVANGPHVVSTCFSPDATLMASAGGQTVKLWTTEFHERLDSHSDEVGCICFSEDGSLIASGSYSDGVVKIWDATNCSSLHTFCVSTDKADITSVVFSPNRILVGAGSADGTVRIWEVESQKSRAKMDGHAFRVTDMRFSPDGSKLVSVSVESIRVWDAETGSVLAFLNAMHPSIEWMTFSDGGEIIVQERGELQRLKLRAVSTSSTLSSTPFDLVLLTDDDPTIRPPPPPSYHLLREQGREWDDQWIVDAQGKRVFHWPDAWVSACYMRKLAVGTSDGKVAILDFSKITY